MRKRKTALVAFLLSAFLGLGVGYAVVTDSLTINGDVTVKTHQENFSVIFSQVETQNQCTASILDDKTVASFSTSQLKTTGDTATAVFQIKNVSPEYSAKITLQDIKISTEYIDTMNDYFTYSAKLNDGAATEVTILKDATATLTVTLTLKKTPNEEKVGKFTISLVTESVEI